MRKEQVKVTGTGDRVPDDGIENYKKEGEKKG